MIYIPNIEWPRPASDQLGGLWTRDQIDYILIGTCGPLLAEIRRWEEAGKFINEELKKIKESSMFKDID